MQTLRVGYGRGVSLGSALIRRWDNVAPRRWSHCGAIVDTRGTPFVVEALAGRGVVVTPFEVFANRYPDFEIVRYQVPDAKAGDDWVCAQIGKPYDYLALLGAVTRTSWQDEDAWQCMELCEMRNVRAGLERFRPGPQVLTPNLGFMVR